MIKYYTPDYRRCGFMDPMVSADDSTEDDDKYVEASEYNAMRQRAEVAEALLRDVEPYLDSLVCYASTVDEHLPNGFPERFRAALAGSTVDRKGEP